METLTVKEAAFHTRTNRFYQLQARERSGWTFPFEELHHRKVIIVKIDTNKDELLKIKDISDIPGIQVIAFPTENNDDFFFNTCGLHPNDASFKIMAKTDDNPVFALLQSMAHIDAVAPFKHYFYLNRNSHLQGVADSADAMRAILQADQP